jgi:hypothetical protein
MIFVLTCDLLELVNVECQFWIPVNDKILDVFLSALIQING